MALLPGHLFAKQSAVLDNATALASRSEVSKSRLQVIAKWPADSRYAMHVLFFQFS